MFDTTNIFIDALSGPGEGNVIYNPSSLVKRDEARSTVR